LWLLCISGIKIIGKEEIKKCFAFTGGQHPGQHNRGRRGAESDEAAAGQGRAVRGAPRAPRAPRPPSAGAEPSLFARHREQRHLGADHPGRGGDRRAAGAGGGGGQAGAAHSLRGGRERGPGARGGAAPRLQQL
jgi:hypothetical protein